MVNVCKYYQMGFCKKILHCPQKHNKEDCTESNCDIKICEKRHRKTCNYFASYCKFGTFCEYKHENPEYLKRIDNLEKVVNKYNDDYEIFLKFFRNDILEKLS